MVETPLVANDDASSGRINTVFGHRATKKANNRRDVCHGGCRFFATHQEG